MSDFMPAAPLLLGALMLPLLPRMLRSLVVVIAPALALLILSQVDLGASMTWLKRCVMRWGWVLRLRKSMCPSRLSP